MKNPFSKKESDQANPKKEVTSKDPLQVEDLLVDGTMKATVTSEGRLISKRMPLRTRRKASTF